MKNNINFNKIYDILIVGCGPGGMSAAVYASRAMSKIAIIEQYYPGGKVTKTSEIENYLGFDFISGFDLSQKMFSQVKKYNINYINNKLIKISKNKEKNFFILELLDKKNIFSKSIIISTGTIEKKLGIPGEIELYGKGVSYCAVCDGNFYKNCDIAVVGGGYAALEEAIYLTKFSNKVYLIHRSDIFNVDKKLIEKVKNNLKIKIILNTIVIKINEEEIKKNVKSINIKNIISNKIEELYVSAIFPYIGSNPSSEFAKDLNVLNDKGYFVVDKKMMTKLPGLFAAGDVTDTIFRQIVTAVSDGAKAAQYAIEYLDNL